MRCTVILGELVRMYCDILLVYYYVLLATADGIFVKVSLNYDCRWYLVRQSPFRAVCVEKLTFIIVFVS